MKYIYTLFLFALVPSFVQGQILIDQLANPALGDSVELFVDATPPDDIVITAPGGDQFWLWAPSDILNEVVSFEENDRPNLFPFANTKASIGGFENYFDIREDEWLLSGQVGEDPFGLGLNVQTFYMPPYKEYYTPVEYQGMLDQSYDVFTGIPLSFIPDSILQQLPVVPDSMRARIVTQQNDEVDAWGLMHISEWEDDVLRVRRERRIGIRIEVKISILPWTDVTDLLATYLDALPFDVSLTDTIVTYQFLAQGFTLPVAELTLDSLGEVGTITYQRPIVNSVRDVRLSAGVDVYPNPASDRVIVTFEETDRIESIRLYDISGAFVESVPVAGRTQVEIPLMNIPSGMCLVTLWDSSGALVGMEKLSVVR